MPVVSVAPVAIQRIPFHTTLYPFVKPLLLLPCPVQIIPSGEVANIWVPSPTATHIVSFHATLYPAVVNGGVVGTIQSMPL